MHAITLDIIGDAGFSHDFGGCKALEEWSNRVSAVPAGNHGSCDGDGEELQLSTDPLLQALHGSLRLTVSVICLAAMNLFWMDKYLDRKVMHTRTVLRTRVDQVIANARDKLTDTGSSNGSCSGSRNTSCSTTPPPPQPQHKSLLQALFDATDSASTTEERHKLSDIELRDEVKTFLMAGHETTGAWCYWALYALAKYPDVQQKLYDNIMEQHVPCAAEDSNADGTTLDEERDNEFITSQQADTMEYLSAFLSEVLRVYTPTGFFVRFTTQKEEWHGYTIPKGTRMLIPMHLLHRHPDHWESPDEFHPERWLDKDECKRRHRFCYLPFSAGGRNCIGQRFAEIEVKVIVAKIVRAFRIQLSPSMRDQEIKFTHFISMKSKQPVSIQVRKRKQSD